VSSNHLSAAITAWQAAIHARLEARRASGIGCSHVASRVGSGLLVPGAKHRSIDKAGLIGEEEEPPNGRCGDCRWEAFEGSNRRR